jgi:two-component system NtrC family sensor kinase
MKAKNAKSSSLEKIIDRQSLAEGSNPFVGILKDLPDAVLLIDFSGDIYYANRQAKNLFGLDAARARTVSKILPQVSLLQSKSRRLAHWRSIETNKTIENFETQFLDRDGRLVEARVTETAIFAPDGKMVGFSAVIKDITKTRESEQRITRRDRQLFALIDVAEAITHLTDVESLLENVLDAVLRVTSLSFGCVHLFDEEDESLILAVQQNLRESAVEMLKKYELGEGIIGKAAVLSETLIVTDTSNDQRLARPVAEEKIGSIAAVPLIGREGVVRGILSLFSAETRAFTAHESSMLTAIGKQVGVALERAGLLQEVNDSRKEWEETFDSMTDGVSIHAPSGKIRRANSSLARMFGASEENLVGIRCCELYHGAKKARADCTIMKTVTERMPQRVELHDRLFGRVLRVITDPIISETGRIVGVVCTTRDVTDEKLIERRLIQQERISAIGEIAAGIAHEVGTPLNIILANVEFLLRGKSKNAVEELEAIKEQTSSITALVHQLLDFSRDHSPEFAPVNINNLIEKTIGLLNHQLQKSKIKTELNLVNYLPSVDGDASQIQRVLFNLVTNARQALEVVAKSERERILRISTDTAFAPTETFNYPHIVIKVEDNGNGIPVDALPNVFNPFFTANKEGGTGLGLAISSRIVQKHSGSLTIENNREYGVTAKIRLPLSQI